jgi:hypothetical protein
VPTTRSALEQIEGPWRGNRQKARWLREKAAEHYAQMGPDGPPFAVALAMPVPRPPLVTWTVATRRVRDPDDAA